MSGRQGGKAKPLKAPKKDKKELDEDDLALIAKRKADADALKAAQARGMWFSLKPCFTPSHQNSRFSQTKRTHGGRRHQEVCGQEIDAPCIQSHN
ncbi:hypothetical protein FRC02_000768 [Tulasnella sp. 418]|nr:hypothetical protein FRC02_000768 [Tulasnella sp. 418]